MGSILGLCAACSRCKATRRAVSIFQVISFVCTVATILMAVKYLFMDKDGLAFLAKTFANVTLPVNGSTEYPGMEILNNTPILKVTRVLTMFLDFFLFLAILFKTDMGPINTQYAMYLITSVCYSIFHFLGMSWAEIMLVLACEIGFVGINDQYWTRPTTSLPVRIIVLWVVSIIVVTGLYLILPVTSAYAISYTTLGWCAGTAANVLLPITCAHAAITIRDENDKPYPALVLGMNASMFCLFNNMLLPMLFELTPNQLAISSVLEIFLVLPSIIPAFARMDKEFIQKQDGGAKLARVWVAVLIVLAFTVVMGTAVKIIYGAGEATATQSEL